MAELRVLVVTTTYPARPNDSTPRFVADLALGVSDRIDVVVLAPRVRDAAPLDAAGPVRVVRFPYAPRRLEGLADGAIVANLRAQPWRILELPGLVIRMWMAIRAESRRFDPDVIHAHWLVPNGLVATLIGRRRPPVLITVHGVDLHAFKTQPLEWLRRLTIRRADLVTAVSGELAQRVRSLGGVRVPIVRMGADFESLVRDEPEPRVPNRVLFVGRLAEKKGVPVLLEAMRTVPELHLRIVGDGPLGSELRQMSAELGLGDRVTFLGRLGRSEVAQELRRASVLAIPSVTGSDGDREGTPVVLGEAVAAGTPVVASAVGGLGELLSSETGWLVEEGRPGELAAALTEAVSAEGRVRAAAADRLIRPQVDLRSTIEAYVSMYEELAESSA